MIKLSIITINYNNEKGLKDTFESIFNQTYKDYEYLVIDGKSNDGSQSLVEKYKNQIDYWVSENDNGVYHAMNKGIRKAQGEFLLFLNSGDILSETKTLEQVIPQLDSNRGIYYGDVKRKKENRLSKRVYPDKLDFSFFYSNSLCHQSSFIKRELFERFFYYNENYKIAADWEFFIYTICKENVPYKHINQVVCTYDFSGMSSQKENADVHLEERLLSIQKYFPAFNEDYKDISKLKSKRTQQLFHIKNYKLAWNILKGFMNMILLFLPKLKK